MGTMADVEGKKLTELRVIDLKTELERRGLDKSGNKAALLERLSKVNDISVFLFFFYSSRSNVHIPTAWFIDLIDLVVCLLSCICAN